jgi:hypothetical protein
LRESKLVMLLERSAKSRLAEWGRLERDMRKIYEMEERALRKLAKHKELEMGKCRGRKFGVTSTGALIDMDSPKSHLECFCSRLSSHTYSQMRPEYIIREESKEDDRDDPPLLRATVILPVTLDPILRVHESRSLWRSKRMPRRTLHLKLISRYTARNWSVIICSLSVLRKLQNIWESKIP